MDTENKQMQGFSVKLKCPFTMLVSGASSSGKTTFVLSLLKKRKDIFSCVSPRIYWFYKIYQDIFKDLDNAIFEKKMCTMDWIEENDIPEGSTIIIDDMALEATEDTAKLFSVGSHHFNVNIIFICQNLFSKNKYFRDISLNSTYVVLFKNIRDKQQISNFAKQFAPGKNKQFIDLFQEATSEPYSYVLLDNHQKTLDEHRIVSNFLLEKGRPIQLWLLH